MRVVDLLFCSCVKIILFFPMASCFSSFFLLHAIIIAVVPVTASTTSNINCDGVNRKKSSCEDCFQGLADTEKKSENCDATYCAFDEVKKTCSSKMLGVMKQFSELQGCTPRGVALAELCAREDTGLSKKCASLTGKNKTKCLSCERLESHAYCFARHCGMGPLQKDGKYNKECVRARAEINPPHMNSQDLDMIHDRHRTDGCPNHPNRIHLLKKPLCCDKDAFSKRDTKGCQVVDNSKKPDGCKRQGFGNLIEATHYNHEHEGRTDYNGFSGWYCCRPGLTDVHITDCVAPNCPEDKPYTLAEGLSCCGEQDVKDLAYEKCDIPEFVCYADCSHSADLLLLTPILTLLILVVF